MTRTIEELLAEGRQRDTSTEEARILWLGELDEREVALLEQWAAIAVENILTMHADCFDVWQEITAQCIGKAEKIERLKIELCAACYKRAEHWN